MDNDFHEHELRLAMCKMKKCLAFAKGQKWGKLSVKMSRHVTEDVADILRGKGYDAKTFGGRVIVHFDVKGDGNGSSA